MKLCKDCKYLSGLIRECKHPNSIYDYDYVDGDVEYHTANFMRKWRIAKACGEEAILFEPKETLANRIKNFFKKE